MISVLRVIEGISMRVVVLIGFAGVLAINSAVIAAESFDTVQVETTDKADIPDTLKNFLFKLKGAARQRDLISIKKDVASKLNGRVLVKPIHFTENTMFSPSTS